MIHDIIVHDYPSARQFVVGGNAYLYDPATGKLWAEGTEQYDYSLVHRSRALYDEVTDIIKEKIVAQGSGSDQRFDNGIAITPTTEKPDNDEDESTGILDPRTDSPRAGDGRTPAAPTSNVPDEMRWKAAAGTLTHDEANYLANDNKLTEAERTYFGAIRDNNSATPTDVTSMDADQLQWLANDNKYSVDQRRYFQQLLDDRKTADAAREIVDGQPPATPVAAGVAGTATGAPLVNVITQEQMWSGPNGEGGAMTAAEMRAWANEHGMPGARISNWVMPDGRRAYYIQGVAPSAGNVQGLVNAGHPTTGLDADMTFNDSIVSHAEPARTEENHNYIWQNGGINNPPPAEPNVVNGTAVPQEPASAEPHLPEGDYVLRAGQQTVGDIRTIAGQEMIHNTHGQWVPRSDLSGRDTEAIMIAAAKARGTWVEPTASGGATVGGGATTTPASSDPTAGALPVAPSSLAPNMTPDQQAFTQRFQNWRM